MEIADVPALLKMLSWKLDGFDRYDTPEIEARARGAVSGAIDDLIIVIELHNAEGFKHDWYDRNCGVCGFETLNGPREDES